MTRKRPAPFKWSPLSKKQMQVLTWWTPRSPYKNKDVIVCDGSIRAGKTVIMSYSYIKWAMVTYQEHNFGMAGKTIGSFRRNVVEPLKKILIGRKYKVKDRRSENMLEITKNGVTNYFYIFGGKDESSQDLIQGITLAGMLFDEVALMPQSFVNQATGRCSVEGSKLWFNCNPAGPSHWFKKEYLDKLDEKNALHLHFTMDDNPSLTERVKERYKRMYSGIFFQRFILGLWVLAEGVIYSMFNEAKHMFEKTPKFDDHVIGVDYGTNNPTAFILFGIKYNDRGDNEYYILDEYYQNGREDGQMTVSQHYQELVRFVSNTPHLKNTRVNPLHLTLYVDPSAAAFKAEVAQHGTFAIKNADNDVVEGIRTVQSMITQDRLFVNKTCENVRKEFGSYVWDEKASDKGIDKPIKEHDHALDAIRYVVYTLEDSPTVTVTEIDYDIYDDDDW